MQQVEQRWKDINQDAGQQLQERLTSLTAVINGMQRQRLITQALNAKTATQKVHWLRRETDLVNQAVRDIAACKSGCSHCCHIGVLISEGEARVIARETGRTLNSPAADDVLSLRDATRSPQAYDEAVAASEKVADRYFGVPCPFLADDQCSIHAHRPLACRRLINADQDALLCRLVPGESIKVPYIDMRLSQMVYMKAWGLHARMADIRDWFA